MIKKQMGKRGIFYTIAAIALTIVLFVTYSNISSYTFSEKMDVIQTRIETVNYFIKDVEKDLRKGIYIAGFRSILSLNQFVTTNGTYVDNVNLRLSEAFLNGTINNYSMSLMKDSTFNDWGNKIAAEAGKIDINFNFTVNKIMIGQTDPWSVEIGVNVSLDIKDKRNTSKWVRESYLVQKISLIGFEDPLYVVNSQGRVTNTILISNITSFVINKDPGNLRMHMNRSYYIAHNDSPGFLMRLEGNLNPSDHGIESLVNLEKFQQQGLTLKARSIVDYIYFGNQITVNHRINKTPEWFKIDNEHLEKYEVTNITCSPSECYTS